MELQTAKLFMNGRSQALRLPLAFRFEGEEVYIRRDQTSGDVVISQKPNGWQGFLDAVENVEVPDGFLSTAERKQDTNSRDPFEHHEGD
ncbi:MAG: hypothetical protein L3J39_08670 [Verrucomicrobiales bacterium]|nr:hypothetical protein [Verrucomicrobiales bacterium]